MERCKDYIANHLRTNFKVHDIADELSINRTYLSKIFSQNEGMTIQQYILRERCEHASNMLRYTNYPISIIANYFCFSSQSHFTKKFQDVYGVTPKEYRKQNKYIESYQRQRQ
ncbi:AraC family transcriptional regulator [Blautia sp. RD014234]|nr:AraC family transcriptional regulator [Blautia parvula]